MKKDSIKLPLALSNTEDARQKRIHFLKENGFKVDTYQNTSLSTEQIKSNIESFLGTMQIPVGLVGPLTFNDNDRLESVYTAAATTEGALVASMNRGIAVINKCGGFSAHVIKQKMLRAPIFCFENLEQSVTFEKWLQSKATFLAVYIKKFSQHAQLLNIKTQIFGRNVEAKFYFRTADAAGQNMTTICTWQSCKWIISEFNERAEGKILDFILDGNGSSDKKISYDSIINGRGTDVVAECIIDEKILNRKLKVTSKQLLRWHAKSRSFITQNGVVGDNTNVANAIAAIFTATGQDIACIHESAIGYLNFGEHEKGLYISLKLPKLVIGTVGGGTSLPSQKENLQLMGCNGADKVERFAKLICGFAMGLELSTSAAMVSGQFAIAHERLGRNKPVQFLKMDDKLNDFIEKEVLFDKKSSIEFKKELHDSNGIITEIAAQSSDKLLGLSIWQVQPKQELLLLKSKPTAKEILNCVYILAGMVNPTLTKSFDKYKKFSDFQNAHKKELLIYEHLHTINNKNIPEIYGLYQNDERETYLIVMAFLHKEDMRIINSELSPDVWTDSDVLLLFKHHFKTLKQLSILNEEPLFSAAKLTDYKKFSKKSLEVIKIEYGAEYTEFYGLYKRCLKFLSKTNNEQFLYTLIHNDFNPRNIAIKKNDRPIIYDWELARVDLPQRDVIEFLSFVIDSQSITKSLEEILENCRNNFNHAFEINIGSNEWLQGAKQALASYIVTRLNLYLIGNKLTKYEFLEHVLLNVLKIAEELKL